MEMYVYVLIIEEAKQLFFKIKNDAKKEMRIEYRTKYETKTYLIKEIREIDETDLSILNSTKEDRITLITCIANQNKKIMCYWNRRIE